MLELAGVLDSSKRNEQVLDRLSVERERGITVKAQTASFVYKYKGVDYLLNLIDTPGHVDFSYEVSRSLAACEGVLLVVDSTQGIQAQTLAHTCLAIEQDLKIIPILNKVDLPHSCPEQTLEELNDLLLPLVDYPLDEIRISAKLGTNVDQVFPAIIERLSPPTASRHKKLRALLFDSWYDNYKGVISLVVLKDGVAKRGDKIRSAHSGKEYEITHLGVLQPDAVETDCLYAGQMGYFVTNMKDPKESYIGDTFLHANTTDVPALPGFKTVQPMVFAGLFPVDSGDFDQLKDALDRLLLNDSSVTLQRTNSTALGLGYRIGFLGMLHMDVFKQRLEEEFEADIILTNPAVPYRLNYVNGENKIVENPCEIPYHDKAIESIEEPVVQSRIMLPAEYIGNVMTLCDKRRGKLIDTDYLNDKRVVLKYELPLAEMAENQFFNELKQSTSGYASLDYEEPSYKPSNIVRLDVLLNGKPIDALSQVTHTSNAVPKARSLASKLKDVIERQQYQIAIQVCVNGKPAARETIQAYRKDVTAKCYGGDQTRKRKLLDRQKEQKKGMKRVANVDLPKTAFLTIIKQ